MPHPKNSARVLFLEHAIRSAKALIEKHDEIEGNTPALDEALELLAQALKKPLTFTDVRIGLLALGITLIRTNYGDLRVNFRGGKPNTAYFTDDLEDALATGRAMAKSMGTWK